MELKYILIPSHPPHQIFQSSRNFDKFMSIYAVPIFPPFPPHCIRHAAASKTLTFDMCPLHLCCANFHAISAPLHKTRRRIKNPHFWHVPNILTRCHLIFQWFSKKLKAFSLHKKNYRFKLQLLQQQWQQKWPGSTLTWLEHSIFMSSRLEDCLTRGRHCIAKSNHSRRRTPNWPDNWRRGRRAT